jgi:type I restriction enzyme S subunit
MKWNETTLSQICISSAFGPRFSSDLYSIDGNIATLRTTDISQDGEINYATMPLAQIDIDNFSKHYLETDDIVITRSGTIGIVALFRNYQLPVLPGAFLIRFRLDSSVYPLFYKYYFHSPVGKGSLLATATGAVQQNLNITNLNKVTVPIPPLPTQRKIASILSAYDDLIENNLKRIKLLEEKAFLRYKWIVDNEIIEEKKLNQVTQFLKRGVSPKYVNEDGVIVLNQKCIRNHIVSFEDSRLTDPEKNISKERMIQKFDTLINSTGTGTLGRIAMNIQDEFALTADSHITIVRANNEITPIYLCMSLFAKENVIEMMGEGATNQTELSPKKLGEEIKIQIISLPIMNEFEREAESIFNLVWNLQKQNTKLREARDILLPKLMSGQIEV